MGNYSDFWYDPAKGTPPIYPDPFIRSPWQHPPMDDWETYHNPDEDGE